MSCPHQTLLNGVCSSCGVQPLVGGINVIEYRGSPPGPEFIAELSRLRSELEKIGQRIDHAIDAPLGYARAEMVSALAIVMQTLGRPYPLEQANERGRKAAEKDRETPAMAKLAEKERELDEARAANGKLVNAFERYGASNINYMERYYEEKARAQKAEDWAAKRWTKRVGELEAKLAEKERELESAQKANAEMVDALRDAMVADANGVLHGHDCIGLHGYQCKAWCIDLRNAISSSAGSDYVHRSELEKAEAKLAEMQGWHPPEMCRAEVERAREEMKERCAQHLELDVAVPAGVFVSGSDAYAQSKVRRLAREIRALGEKKAKS